MNSCIPLTPAAARAEWARMTANPVPLARPVLVPSGWRAWSIVPRAVVKALSTLTGNPENRFHFLGRAFPTISSIPRATESLITAAASAWPSDDPAETVALDVVAISMGGLVSRLAALPPDVREAFGVARGLPRLNVKRLFTLATPHRGAKLARWIPIDAAARDMRPGSPFLRALDAAEPLPRRYQLTCYARLHDAWVGATNTAPAGAHPIWVPTHLHELAHLRISSDKRILLDIARRLRVEQPLATNPSPPPRD